MCKKCEIYVYLAGPIAGTTYDERVGWRNRVGEVLREMGLTPLSPMRGKGPETCEPGFDRESTPITSAKAIKARDKYDVRRSAVVLVNFLGAAKESIGTAYEFAWADVYGVPVVVVMEPSGNPNDHPFNRDTAFCVVPTLDEAIAVITAIVFP